VTLTVCPQGIQNKIAVFEIYAIKAMNSLMGKLNEQQNMNSIRGHTALL